MAVMITADAEPCGGLRILVCQVLVLMCREIRCDIYYFCANEDAPNGRPCRARARIPRSTARFLARQGSGRHPRPLAQAPCAQGSRETGFSFGQRLQNKLGYRSFRFTKCRRCAKRGFWTGHGAGTAAAVRNAALHAFRHALCGMSAARVRSNSCNPRLRGHTR